MANIIRDHESSFRHVYGSAPEMLEKQFGRYDRLNKKHRRLFGEKDVFLFSTPGRTEIGGNHTDHNHGRVLAASVNLDSIAVASLQKEQRVTLFSEGYDEPFVVDLHDLAIRVEEQGTTQALIRGIAARFQELGYRIGGFDACMSSDVLPGSGLSSSASVEVLIGTVFSALYNDSDIPPEMLAIIGQYAENNYFGKPCGLMDQLACGVGGIVSIDFADPQHPVVDKVEFDFSAQGYNLLVVDTGGNHADLTSDYAAVPAEMKAVARTLGEEVCREIEFETLLSNIPLLRKEVGDRAVLRALHFLGDHERVKEQVAALKANDFQRFLTLVNASGNSSFKWLQNIFTVHNVREQGISLALALTEHYIEKTGEGACRVHGGGFAGTIQVFLPETAIAGYARLMEAVFGEDSVLVIGIRSVGTLCLHG